MMGPQYPWYWSAAVLAGLFGLSACILNFSRQIAGPAEVTPIVDFHEVSKWYGNVIGINKLTIHIPAGVTGLLGPNGAGKSTLLQLATGQLYPSQGTVRVLGQKVWNNPALNRFIGLCPEQDAFYEWMTGWDFVYTSARLSGMSRSEARNAAERTLEAVGMTKNKDRAIRGYSKGMRQRIEAGPGAGPRSGGAVPRRAAHRHRSGGPPRPDGHHSAAWAAKEKACWFPATCCTKCNR